MLEIKKEEIESLPQFKSSIYWGPDNTLYKVIRSNYRENRDDYYLYVSNLPDIEGLVLPIDLIKDDKIFGYQLPYIEGSKNIDEFVKKPNKDADIMAIIKSIFKALENINVHLVLGDVRNTNILIKGNEATFIDWDYGKKKHSKETLLVCYCLAIHKRIIPDSKLSDIFKTLLSALSIYYGVDMEEYFANKDLSNLLQILYNINANPNLIYYLEYLIEKFMEHSEDIDLNFSNVVDYIEPPSSKEKERLVRILPH